MTQEALKLALEALEEAWYHVGTFQPTEKAIDLYDEARAAIKDALEQTQEPVAWIHNFIEGGISIGKRPADLERHPDRWTALYKEPKPCPTCEALARTVMLDQTSHDTTPPQRTWVELSVFEITDLVDSIEYEEYQDLVKKTEAKLKQKNGYAEENT